MIKIQKKNFDIEKEIALIKSKYKEVGAVSIFIGYVRNINNKKKVKYIDLEVYEDMAYKNLNNICDKAKKKFKINETLVIHRYGRRNINQKIVLVATFSMNRKNSYESCKYIMDYFIKNI